MDNTLTNQIEKFLSIRKPSDEEIRQGAMLLLKVNPGGARGIYNSAMTRPQSMLPWIQADLKKFLAIRKRGLERRDVAKYNAETVTLVRETLSRVPDTVVKHADAGLKAELGKIPETGIRGKRPDHDALPDDIKAIWERNAERWKKMRQLHAQLEVMVTKPDYQPCDGNELCHLLRQTDTELRNDYRRYDEWKEGASTANGDGADAYADKVKAVGSARTAISRGLQRKTQDEKSLAKIQEAVNTLHDLGQDIKPATVEKLKAIGVAVPDA